MVKNLIFKKVVALIFVIVFTMSLCCPTFAASGGVPYTYMIRYSDTGLLSADNPQLSYSVLYNGTQTTSTQRMVTTNTVGNAQIQYGSYSMVGSGADVTVGDGFNGTLSVVDPLTNGLYSSNTDTLIITASFTFHTVDSVASIYTGFTNNKWGHLIRFIDGKAKALGGSKTIMEIDTGVPYDVGIVVSHQYNTISYNINGNVVSYSFSELGYDSTYKVDRLRPIYVDGASNRNVSYSIGNFGVKKISSTVRYGKADSEFFAHNIYGCLLSDDLLCSADGITSTGVTVGEILKAVESDASGFYSPVGFIINGQLSDKYALNTGDTIRFSYHNDFLPDVPVTYYENSDTNTVFWGNCVNQSGTKLLGLTSYNVGNFRLSTGGKIICVLKDPDGNLVDVQIASPRTYTSGIDRYSDVTFSSDKSGYVQCFFTRLNNIGTMLFPKAFKRTFKVF